MSPAVPVLDTPTDSAVRRIASIRQWDGGWPVRVVRERSAWSKGCRYCIAHDRPAVLCQADVEESRLADADCCIQPVLAVPVSAGGVAVGAPRPIIHPDLLF